MDEKPTADETAIWQRRLASQANNRAWTLAEAASRTPAEDEAMLEAAMAARHLWQIVGDEKNRAHAAQLLAHVYALLKLPNPASHYLAQSHPLLASDLAEPWERALAHAVAANVAAARGDTAAHRDRHRAATAQIAALPDPEDRAILEATLRVVPKPPC